MNSAEKIQLLRKEKGITQKELADILGLNITAIANYENKNTPRLPRKEILKRLCEYFGVSQEYILDDTIENKTNENIAIGDVLGLSDEAINTLKKYNSFQINKYLSSKYFEYVCMDLDYYDKISSTYVELERFSLLLKQITAFPKENIAKTDLYNCSNLTNKNIQKLTQSFENVIDSLNSFTSIKYKNMALFICFNIRNELENLIIRNNTKSNEIINNIYKNKSALSDVIDIMRTECKDQLMNTFKTYVDTI